VSSTSGAPCSEVGPESAANEAGAGRALRLSEHTVEIVCTAGEGARKCGRIFGSVSAKMGNGVWTEEIIPAEIQPPPRTASSASGSRIRLGSAPVTNWGDEADLVIAFDEQVLLSRHRLDALAEDALVLVESMWAEHDDPDIREAWEQAMRELSSRSYRIVPVPMEDQCLSVVDDPRRGKNMFALGLLTHLYGRDVEKIRDQIAREAGGEPGGRDDANVALLELGIRWAEENLDLRIEVPPMESSEPRVLMNGNQAIAMGAVAAGMELCAMYPITPATGISHTLCERFEEYGGIVHQAEDEIAAAGVAVGSSYAGNVAFTVTSGPGLALKTEFIALAVMTETPLVVVDVQRGGPSTGLPTKVEQSDLLAAVFGQPGDAPHVVLAPSTIEECFHSMVTARRIAEAFRCVVIVLTDASLATGLQPFRRPELDPRWQAAPLDLAAPSEDLRPFGWDPATGLSPRSIPGQPGAAATTTSLAHDEWGRAVSDPDGNQRGCAMRSRKMAVLQQTLMAPVVHGDESSQLLVVGWGSTRGAIEEAVDRARSEGSSVSSLHLSILSPMQPGLRPILERSQQVMTVEINYSDTLGDPHVTDENRRRGQLAWLLRAHTLVDVDCWTRVPGEPLRPGAILKAIRDKLLSEVETT
jgi:2-oxoglutarate ferredoxin oxidoreductase subunit alpha